MVDKKISELPQIIGDDVDSSNDIIPIVDSSTDTTKSISAEEFLKAVGESGSNPNGVYVRLADGTQICWVERDLGSITANGAGTGAAPYRTSSVDGGWPASFIDPPSVTAMPKGPFDNFSIIQTMAFGHVRHISAGSYFGLAAVRPADVSSTSVDFKAYLTAIGRWY